MNNEPIEITDGPGLPNIGYYEEGAEALAYDTSTNNSYNNLMRFVNDSCQGTSPKTLKNGIYSPIFNIPTTYNTTYDTTTLNIGIPEGTNILDYPYYIGKNGNFNNEYNEVKYLTLKDVINININLKDIGITNITNQIKYLVCQLIKERNRKFDKDMFNVINNNLELKTIFKNFAVLKPFLVIIFALSMYILINGLIVSIDLGLNIFDIIINKKRHSSNWYWLGLCLGLVISIVTICAVYTNLIKKNIEESQEYNITNNPYGIKKDVSTSVKKLDYAVLIISVLIIYGLIALSFIILKFVSSTSYYKYSIIFIILFIIFIIISLLYCFLPFLSVENTNDVNDVNNGNEELRLYISNQNNVEQISTNLHQNSIVNKAFIITFVIILILTCIFFYSTNMENNFLQGFLSSSAILAIPSIWLFNILIGLNYFYLYPLLYIFLRIFRYIYMSILFLITETYTGLKDKYSPDLLNILNNFKSYTPSLGLIFVDELKIVMNMCGYENNLSKLILTNDNGFKNLSQNKYVSFINLYFITHYLRHLFNKTHTNHRGIVYFVFILVITVIVSSIILSIYS